MNVQDVEKIAGDLTKYMTQIAQQYGPKAWEIVCGVKRMESLGELLWGLCWVIMFCVSMWVGGSMRRWYKKCEAEELAKTPEEHLTEKQKTERFNDKMCYMIAYTIYLFVSIALFGGNMAGYIFNIWNWIGVFDPGIAIAHDIMQKALTTH